MSTHYPSMTSLRALDALARLGSVSAAAEELSLTRGAVSHSLALLEERLGFELTERSGRGIRLTERGKQYADDVRRILADVLLAGRPQQDAHVAGRLCISCTPGFSNYWLCRHIDEFQGLYPKVQLHIVSPRTMDDTGAAEADIFIAYGVGDWTGLVSELLIALHDFPVCSPRLLNALGGLRHPKELAAYPLLHMKDSVDWRRWLAVAGAADVNAESGIVFADATTAISACLAAQGVTIGDQLLCGDALNRGLLVKPFDIEIPANRSYYLVADELKLDRPVVKAFANWLKEKVAFTTQRSIGLGLLAP